jgi:hypothetical protein
MEWFIVASQAFPNAILLGERLNPDLFPVGFLSSSKRFRGRQVRLKRSQAQSRAREATKMKEITQRALLGTTSAA